MSDDEYDNIPDDFAELEGVDWTRILSGSPPSLDSNVSIQGISALATARSPSADSSTHYSCDDDELGPSFFAELDSLEKTLTQNQSEPIASSSSVPNTRISGRSASSCRGAGSDMINISRYFPNTSDARRPSSRAYAQSPKKLSGENIVLHPPHKRSRAESSSFKVSSPKKKGKVHGNESVHKVLSGFEDELSCPICSDLFVAAHLGNPCGHSFCGDCGWQWKMKGKNACAICRTQLSATMPMIPNFAMDNTVEKHISALGESGLEEWKPGGAKYREWHARKEQWKKGVAERAKAARQVQTGKQRMLEVTNFLELDLTRWEDDVDDPDYEDEHEDEVQEIAVPPGRWYRTRHRR